MLSLTTFNEVFKGKARIILILLFLLFIIVSASVIFTLQNNRSQDIKKITASRVQTSTSSRRPFYDLTKQKKGDKIVASILDDNIYEFQIEEIQRQFSNLDNDNILRTLKEDSLLLQKAKNEGLIQLPNQFFSKEYKQNPVYLQEKNWYLSQIEAEYKKRSSVIEGAIITVFFYNQKFSSLNFEEADKLAFDLINEARNKILTKEWTTDQAISELTKKEKIKLLDRNYLYNTGFSFPKTAVYDLFRDHLLIEKLRSMDNGEKFQVSPIYRLPGEIEIYGKEYFEKHKQANGFYFFFVIFSKSEGFYEPFYVWKERVIKS